MEEKRIEKLYELLEKIRNDLKYEEYIADLRWAIFQLENK